MTPLLSFSSPMALSLLCHLMSAPKIVRPLQYSCPKKPPEGNCLARLPRWGCLLVTPPQHAVCPSALPWALVLRTPRLTDCHLPREGGSWPSTAQSPCSGPRLPDHPQAPPFRGPGPQGEFTMGPCPVIRTPGSYPPSLTQHHWALPAPTEQFLLAWLLSPNLKNSLSLRSTRCPTVSHSAQCLCLKPGTYSRTPAGGRVPPVPTQDLAGSQILCYHKPRHKSPSASPRFLGDCSAWDTKMRGPCPAPGAGGDQPSTGHTPGRRFSEDCHSFSHSFKN